MNFADCEILRIFKNNSFSSGQGVVQIKPNSVLSITSEMKVKQKELVEKIGFSYGILRISRKRNFKKRFFFIGLRSCWNQTKRGMEYHQFNESVKPKKIVRACRGKSWVFIRNFANFANCEFLKILNFFSAGEGVVQIKPNSVLSINSVMRVQSKKVVGIACLGKKMVFHTEFCEFRELRNFENFKKILFHQVKELSKSNQTRYWVSPV